ncbi:hypothetical protein SK128_008555 [Halocaridina rubra]|uniref:Uncharacterized protein n=1 Tax=Halocaridina rubra TaxID=373956 RepID=A0AAN8XLK1_HALRR
MKLICIVLNGKTSLKVILLTHHKIFILGKILKIQNFAPDSNEGRMRTETIHISRGYNCEYNSENTCITVGIHLYCCIEGNVS